MSRSTRMLAVAVASIAFAAGSVVGDGSATAKTTTKLVCPSPYKPTTVRMNSLIMLVCAQSAPTPTATPTAWPTMSLAPTSSSPDPVVTKPPTMTYVAPTTYNAPTISTPGRVVTPGAFCSPAGATGVTVAGTPMVCRTSATDSRNRWRATWPGVVDRSGAGERLRSASARTDQWTMTRVAVKSGRQGRKIAILLPRGCPKAAAEAIAKAVREAMDDAAISNGVKPERLSIYATWHPQGGGWWNGRIEVAKRVVSPSATRL